MLQDTLNVKSLIIFVLAGFGSICMGLIRWNLSDSLIYFVVVFFFTGIALGGPFSMIGGAVSIDLAKQPIL